MGLCFSELYEKLVSDGSHSVPGPTLLEQQSSLQAMSLQKPPHKEKLVAEPRLRPPMERTSCDFSSCGLSLLKSASKGEYAEAHRLFLRMRRLGGNPSDYVDELSIQRIDRIGRKFILAMEMFMPKIGIPLTERNTHSGIHWGMKRHGDELSIVAVQDYDVDFATMVGFELQRGPDNLSFVQHYPGSGASADIADIASALRGNSAHESCWRRRVIDGICGTLVDDIIMVSSLNALDEPLNGVCIMQYALAQTASGGPCGARKPDLLTAAILTPLGMHGDKARGVRKCQCTKMKLQPQDNASMKMPNACLTQFVDERLETSWRLTCEKLKSFDIDEVRAVPGRAEYLESIRQRISLEAVPVRAFPKEGSLNSAGSK